MFKDVKSLSKEELEFYSRQIVLTEVGYDGQVKLKNSSVLLAGLGGLGSSIALQLAGIGVGHLRLVECDIVELSNLHRQQLYGVNFIGYPKVEVAARRLRELNPNIDVEPLPLSLNVNNAEDLIRGIDVVVDGLDRMSPRYALNRACQKIGVPYVFAGAIMTFGNVSTIIPGKTPCLECFQGGLNDDTLPTCATVGIYTSILGIIASIEVAEATKIILGRSPHLANKLFYCDIEEMQFEEIEIAKAEDCPVCGSEPSGSPKPLKFEFITEVCGRFGKRAFVITPDKNLELNLGELYFLLKKSEFKVKIKANLGITFGISSNKTVSILKSGIMVIDGVKNEKEALDLYKKIIVRGMNFPINELSGD